MAMPRFSAGDYAAVSVVVLLHVLGLWALIQYAPARAAMNEATTLMVSLIKPETPPKVIQPEVIPPKPRPQVVKLKPQPVRLVAQTPLPALAEEVYIPPPEPNPEPVAIEAPPAPPPSPPAPIATPVLPITPPETSADYANNPLPQYPAISRRMGEEGRLKVRVCVKVDGTVLSATVSKSCGSERLDRATVDALQQWRFKPAHRGDEPVAGCVTVPWTWSLNN
jgi:protein TonB